jgi:HPt (histidine-containing phosphotransfer) domain-containing protein
MAIRLKDLVAGQQRLQQQDEAPVRLNPDQFKGLVQALSGAATSAGAKSGAQIFEEFVTQTRKREELLKDATDEQKAIFDELEGTLKQLQTANHADSVGLRRSIDALNRRLAGTPNTAAKSRMVSLIPAAPASASTKNTFAPTLTPENYAINENATTVGNAEVKNAGKSEGGIGAAISGIGSAIGGLAEGIGRAIQGLGSVLGAAIQGLVGLFTGKAIGNILGGGSDLPDVIGGDTNSKKSKRKGPQAEPTFKDKYKKNLGRGFKLGIAGVAANLIGNTAADALTRSGNENAGAAVGIGTDILGYAGTGAMIGSFLGPGGTAAGATIGGVVGAGMGLYNRTNAFDKGGVLDGGAIATKNPQQEALKSLQSENQVLTDSIHTGSTVINNISAPPNAAALASGPVFAPGPSIRPNESAYEKYQMRIFSL